MARSRRSVPKRKPRAKPKKTTPQKRLQMHGIALQAMSIDQFARAHGINRSSFYEMLKKGEGPQCLMVGRRRLITMESAAAWRASRVAASSYPALDQREGSKEVAT